MSLLFFDGFELESDTSTRNSWDAAYGGYGRTNTMRSGSRSLMMSTSDSYRSKYFAAVDTVVVGFAYYYPASSGYTFRILEICYGGTVHVYLEVNSSAGTLTIKRGDGTAFATLTWYAGQWRYLELKVKIHPTTGLLHTKLDGATVFHQTGLNTSNGGGALCEHVNLRGYGGSGTYYDDFYLLDTLGDPPCNDFLNQPRVALVRPAGAGSNTQWSPSSGANYQCVDDVPTDTNDYVWTNTDANRDDYALGDLGLAADAPCYGVMAQYYARRDTIGVSSSSRPILNLDETFYEGTLRRHSDGWHFFYDVWEKDPSGLKKPWTWPAVNNLKAGTKYSES